MTQRFHFNADGEELTAHVYPAAKPLGFSLLLGHGTRAGQHDNFIVDYATGIAERGVLVVTYDFPFAEHGRRNHDRPDVLEECCRAAIVAARQCRPKNRLFVGGKSLSGRVACSVAATGGEEVSDLAGVVVLGYPLHAIGEPDAPRWGRLRAVRVPVLIVQGSRDVFGTPDELLPALADLPSGSRIHGVEGGDHSFTVPTRQGQPQQEVHAGIQDEIVRWMSEITAERELAPRARPVASRARVP